jgi:CO/xanthine dehydrogenase Mo-binding subunit
VDWSRFVVVDHRDIPGPNETYLIENDQPVLAAERVLHVHEAVVLVAHESREMVRRAVREVEVIVDEEVPALDFRVPPAPEQVQRGPDNVLKRIRIEKGDVDGALARAAHVVEGVYETGAQEHVYIEPQGMAAWVERGPAGDVVVVQGSMQCPYYVLNALKHALGREASRVRVVQAPTGGGFGGKEDYPSTIALHAALLTLKAGGRPVKIVYDRIEDMAATTKRHPSLVRHRTGVDRAGRLVAQDIEVVLDGGAYVTLSPVVLSRGMIHAAGPYSCENVRIEGRAVLTNSVPYGAFRGFGAPQTQFACERHMDRVAAALGMDPVELRRVNLLRNGETTATGQVVGRPGDPIDPRGLLEAALADSGYAEKRAAHAVFNASHPYLRRGVGVAAYFHGCGFTGNGEVYLQSRQEVAGVADGGGRVEVLSASTEMGQGTSTILAQVAADRLGLAPGDVGVATPDTARVPNSGPTVASRTAMVVGRLVEAACDDLRRQVGLGPGARGDEVKRAIVAWHRAHPGEALRGRSQYEKPPWVNWDEESYRGDAYATFSWGACVAEVEVDLRTWGVRVTGLTAVQDAGRILNQTLARGQAAGGAVQAVGWALMEDVKLKDGAMANHTLTNYIIPTSGDVPPIRVRFVETPYSHGGGGAKGLGELPMDGPAPAIVNAVADATGADPCDVPLTPERLMDLLRPHAGA